MLRLVVVCSTTVLLVVIASFTLFSPVFGFDARVLVDSLPSLHACLVNGEYSGCTGVSHFPLFQYAVGYLLYSGGATPEGTLRALAVLNFASFVGTALILYRVLRSRSRALAVAAEIVLVTSPMLWYAIATHGEAAAAFITIGYVAACVGPAAPTAVGALLFLAALTKEPALPFLLLLGGLCLLLNGRLRRSPYLAALVVASVGSVAASAAFNHLRFGTWHNVRLLEPILRVHRLSTQVNFFLGLWLSPNGGMLIFWTSFVACLVGIVTRVRRQRALVSTVVLGTLALLTLGFSRWWAPFGWIAWGPRLMLPWIPSLLLIMFLGYPREGEELLTSLLGTRRRRAVTITVLILVSIPQFAVLFDQQVVWQMFAPTARCPTRPLLRANPSYYYHCMHGLVWPWPRDMTILRLFPAAAEPKTIAFTLVYASFLTCSCLCISDLLRSRRTTE